MRDAVYRRGTSPEAIPLEFILINDKQPLYSRKNGTLMASYKVTTPHASATQWNRDQADFAFCKLDEGRG